MELLNTLASRQIINKSLCRGSRVPGFKGSRLQISFRIVRNHKQTVGYQTSSGGGGKKGFGLGEGEVRIYHEKEEKGE